MALPPIEDWLSDYRSGKPTATAEPPPPAALPDTDAAPAPPPDPVIQPTRPIDEWLSDYRAGKVVAPAAPPSTINKPITDEPTSMAGQVIKNLPDTVKHIALDLYGVHAKIISGLVKGATLGAIDPEAGTVAAPNSSDKKQVAVPLSTGLRVLGVSPEIADNPDISSGMGLPKALAMGAEAVGVPPRIAENRTAQGIVGGLTGPEGAGSLLAWGGISKAVGVMGKAAGMTPEAVLAKAQLAKFTSNVPQAISQFIGPAVATAGKITQEAFTGALFGLGKVRGPDEDPVVNAFTGATIGAVGAAGVEALGAIGKTYKVAQLVQLKNDISKILYESGTLTQEAADHQAARVVTNTVYKKGGIGQVSVADIKESRESAKETFEKILKDKAKAAEPKPEPPVETTAEAPPVPPSAQIPEPTVGTPQPAPAPAPPPPAAPGPEIYPEVANLERDTPVGNAPPPTTEIAKVPPEQKVFEPEVVDPGYPPPQKQYSADDFQKDNPTYTPAQVDALAEKHGLPPTTPPVETTAEPTSPTVEAATPSLPRELAGAKPRYSYGSKQFDLQFQNDVDKAAYIAAQKTPSKRDADYVRFAMRATGLDEAGVRAHGANVREQIKNMARDAEPGSLVVPTVTRSDQSPEGVKKALEALRGGQESPLSSEPEGGTLKGDTHEDLQRIRADRGAQAPEGETGTGIEGVRPGGDRGRVPLEEVPPQDVRGNAESGNAPRLPETSGAADSERGSGPSPAAPAAGDEPTGSVSERPGTDSPDVGEPAKRGGAADAGAGPTEQQPPRGHEPANYRITEADKIGSGSLQEKYQHNVTAIRTLKTIESEGRHATPAEQAILAKYTGWGGMPQVFDRYNEKHSDQFEEIQKLLDPKEYEAARASTPNAHYTSPEIIQGIYKALERFGFKGGRILEPSAGSGNFIGMAPGEIAAKSKFSGVELDDITARIAKHLYPKSDIRSSGFEAARFPENYFDAAISNVPFGDYGVHDPEYKKRGLSNPIHNYFFAKSIDKIRPGGVMAFITSHYTLDSANNKLRQYLADKADLVGAIRLPNTAFKKNANTQVTTDILFFKKREPGAKPDDQSWIGTRDIELTTPDEDYPMNVRINNHIADHPEMVIGEHSLEGGMYRNNEYTVKPIEGQDLGKALDAAVQKLPKDIYSEPDHQRRMVEDSAEKMLPKAPDFVKEGGLFVHEGAVFRRLDGNSVPHEGVSVPHLQDILNLRDAVRRTLRNQLVGAPDAQIKKDIEELNKVYDGFVKEWGHLDEKKNHVFAEDPDYPVLLGLEKLDRSTGKYAKADIFKKQVLFQQKKIEKADSTTDALNVSLNELGRIDFKRMESLTGKSTEELQKELKGLIFKDPTLGKHVTADEYLSENVRQKLADAESAAKNDPAFKDNVEALKAVQPPDLKPSEIEARLGSPWVPPSDIEAFIQEVTGVNRAAKVSYVPETGSWFVEPTKYGYGLDESVGNNQTYGTARRQATQLIEDALNSKEPIIYDRDAEGKSSVNPKETELARDRQAKLRDKFKGWLMSNVDRATRLSAIYNERFNNMRLRTYDGSHLTLPGSNPLIKFRPHQKNGVWRAMQNHNTLLAHCVGSGKTYEIAAIAMETKRQGIAKKTMITTLNSSTGTVVEQFLQLYPGANLLVATKKDLTPQNRRIFTSRIATGDWDAVILPHSSFVRIPMSNERIAKFIRQQIADLHDAAERLREDEGSKGRRSGSRAVKDLEKAKKRLMEKLEDRLALGEGKKDDALPFEELGIDQLIVDEAQLFKNLFVPTKMTRVRGLNQSDSERAFDMFMKTSYINEINGGRGVVFSTGTPVTNTVAEMYVMQKYLQNDQLKATGIHNFDSWASNFGDLVSGFELNVSGEGFRPVTRFAKFINVPELLSQFYQVADIQTAKMLKLPVPDIKGGKPTAIVAPRSPDLETYIKQLVARAEAVKRGNVAPQDDNMLKISTDGRKAALDMRLVDPSADDYPDSKVNKMVDRVHALWKEHAKTKSTQLIFSDLGTPNKEGRLSIYGVVKQKLIAKGIPEKEIAFIQDTKGKDPQRNALFDRVNNGDVRVLIGSTDAMGIGTNVQRRLVAAHHLDVPYRPDWLEQRDGRILRQGNEIHKEVEINRYSTEGSFDAFMWQTVVRKAAFIYQVLSGEVHARTMEDLDEATLNYKEIMAATTGNPLIKEKIETDGALMKLQSLQKSYFDNQVASQKEIAELPGKIEGTEAKKKTFERDLETVKEKPETFEVEIEGKKFDDRAKAGEKVMELAKAHAGIGVINETEIGTYRGQKLFIRTSLEDQTFLQMENRYYGLISATPDGVFQSLDYAINPGTIAKRIEHLQKEIFANKKRLGDLKNEVGLPFEHQAKLDKLIARQKELEGQLDLNKGESNLGAKDESEPGEAPPAPSELKGGSATLYEADLEQSDEDEEIGSGGDGSTQAAKGQFTQEFERKAAKVPIYVGEARTTLGGIEYIKPTQLPEIVELVKNLMGKYPEISRRMGANTLGLFNHQKMRIRLNPAIFKDPILALQVLLHELGHLIDYLPDHVTARGNLLGRLKSLTRFLRQTFGDEDVKNRDLRQELIGLSEWWRPYDKEAASQAFQDYRNSPAELYADAISALFVAPSEFQDRAPTFYEEFFKSLDSKPDVKDGFFELMQLLNQSEGELLEHRSKNIEEMFEKAKEVYELKRAQKENADKHIWERLKMALDYVFDPIIRKQDIVEAQGRKLPDESNPRYLLDELGVMDNANRIMLADFQKNVLDPIKPHITYNELGKITFWRRVMAGRADIGNPLGTTPETAKKGLDEIEARLGPEAWNTVMDAAKHFYGMVFDIVKQGVEVGTVSKETFENTVIPNKESYAALRTLDHVQAYVSPGLHAHVGTLKEIENPVTTTILKMIAMTRLNILNHTKNAVVSLLQQEFGHEITKAKPIIKGDGVRVGWQRVEDRDVLERLEDGHVVGYQVDPLIAKGFKQWNNHQLAAVARIMRNFSGNKFFRGAWIGFNAGFMMVTHPSRNFKRTYKLLPGNSVIKAFGRLVVEYAKGAPDAWARAKGETTPLLDEMLKNNAFIPNLLEVVSNPQDDQMTIELKKHGLLPNDEPPATLKRRLFKPVIALGSAIKFMGAFHEALSRIAGYQFRKKYGGEKGKALAYNTRNLVATPNVTRKGDWTPVANEVFIFSNVMKEDYKTQYEAASDPKTRSGYWWRTAFLHFLPKTLMFLAAAGYGGKKLKEYFDRVPDYDKANYTIIPLGKYEGGDHGWKAVYARIVDDPVGRLLGSAYWKTLMAIHNKDSKELNGIFKLFDEHTPGFMPGIKGASAWEDYLSGRNPYDKFFGRNILSDDEQKSRSAPGLASSWPALKKMVEWSLNQTGQIKVATYDDATKTRTETVLEHMPIANSIFKISDYGIKESIKSTVEPMEGATAYNRLEKHQIISDTVNALRKGDTKALSNIPEAMKNGVQFTKGDMRKLAQRMGTTDFQDYIDRLPTDEAVAVYKTLSDEDKKTVAPIVGKKIAAARR